MRSIDVCRTLDTPRFRVNLLVLIAGNLDKIGGADVMLANLRRVITGTDCQPDPLTDDWRLPLI